MPLYFTGTLVLPILIVPIGYVIVKYILGGGRKEFIAAVVSIDVLILLDLIWFNGLTNLCVYVQYKMIHRFYFCTWCIHKL